VTARATPGRRPLLRAVQLVSLAAVAGLFALLVWRIVDVARGSHLVAAIRSGAQPAAPQFRLPVLWAREQLWPESARRALHDHELSLRELRGYPVVLNFWASWCVPCREEAPRFAASARAHAGDVAFVGVNVQDFRSSALRFLTRFEVPYVSVHAGGGKSGIYTDYGLTGLPETYWLDARGRIVAHFAGGVSREQLEAGIRKAVAAS
jgi:cytochrome c biogenesis protein CcmG, thiol:disulfide interchange protein DsbE